MAFSLEAALVVPLAVSTWLGLLMAAEPAYCEVRQAARLEVLAAGYGLESQHIYQTKNIELNNVWTPALQTSPQGVLELASLIRDDWQIINRLISEAATGQPQAGELSP